MNYVGWALPTISCRIKRVDSERDRKSLKRVDSERDRKSLKRVDRSSD